MQPMKKRDFTPRQLKPFDGIKSEENPDARVLIGVLGKVYDMTKGKSFYGPGKNGKYCTNLEGILLWY